MSSSVIPTSVPATGPQFSVFPNEIFIKIFIYLLQIPATAKMGTIVDVRYFQFHFRFGQLPKLRRVSKLLSPLAIAAFYQANVFHFRLLFSKRVERNAFGAYGLPLLPPPAFRKCLRSIRIGIHLVDFFLLPATGEPTAHTTANGFVRTPIVSTSQLLAVCPGARFLHGLGETLGGLQALELDILADFRMRDLQKGIQVYRDAQFVVRVAEVKVNFVDGLTIGHQVWHDDLKQAIGL
ncbi:hypothetical protein BDW02DRAFT_380173 [Decorospora gaudefroyi]|uniref:Uncharacterized protein n=1 Tax=Decorospora gaudefroyi TaxID=184978 RepID=A0A6A5KA76_9PLEO|nr:hypothetical protein BDW02DRAFT_380173 [Decorospora gaudefroyi]